MTENTGIQIVLTARPQGTVRLNDFQLKEFPIPAISAGGLLLEVNYLSLDPYMRGRMDDRKSYAEPMKIGDVMPGERYPVLRRTAMMKKVEVERFSLISSNPFEEITRALEAAIAHPSVGEMYAAIHTSQSVAGMESAIENAVGSAGLMLFFKFDHGVIVGKGSGRESPGTSAFSSAIRSSCERWPDMFLTPAPMRPLRSLWMSVTMACTFHMTRWPVFWLHMRTPLLWKWRGTSMRRSRPCCSERQVEAMELRQDQSSSFGNCNSPRSASHEQFRDQDSKRVYGGSIGA